MMSFCSIVCYSPCWLLEVRSRFVACRERVSVWKIWCVGGEDVVVLYFNFFFGILRIFVWTLFCMLLWCRELGRKEATCFRISCACGDLLVRKSRRSVACFFGDVIRWKRWLFLGELLNCIWLWRCRGWLNINRRNTLHQRSWASGKSSSKRLISGVTRSPDECGRTTMPRLFISLFCSLCCICAVWGGVKGHVSLWIQRGDELRGYGSFTLGDLQGSSTLRLRCILINRSSSLMMRHILDICILNEVIILVRSYVIARFCGTNVWRICVV